MALRVVQFLALVFTALALVPGGAHLFAMPNKLGMAQADYFVAQSVYRGWALLGSVLFPALVLNGVLAVMTRGRGIAPWLAGAAAAGPRPASAG